MDNDKIDENDICYICYDINNNESVLLYCDHKFHHDCIIQNYNYTKQKECPYCRYKYKFLPLPEGKTPICGLHKEYKSNLSYSPYYNIKYCKGFFKNGKPCHYRAYPNGYCKRHEKQLLSS